jgi:hypothetical protein
MTAARHFDCFAAVPGHDEIAAMAPAAIYSVLAKDTDTNVAIGEELADIGATPQEVTATFAVLAAAMLTEACGGTAEARRLAARWARKITIREARVIAARSAGSA